jgi:cytoskeletal protein RodZ
MNSARPGPPPHSARPPGQQAIGITLAPGPGRLAALLIVGLPLLILAVIIWNPIGGGSPSGNGPPAPLSAVGAARSSRDIGHRPVSEPPATETPSIVSPSTEVTAAVTATPTETAAATPTETVTPPAPSGSSPSAFASGPAVTVQQAYRAVNHHAYRIAYSLGLAEPSQTYASFVAGYLGTISVTLTIAGVQGDVVTVSLTAVHKNGARYKYAGTYTVSDGHITSAQIQPTG